MLVIRDDKKSLAIGGAGLGIGALGLKVARETGDEINSVGKKVMKDLAKEGKALINSKGLTEETKKLLDERVSKGVSKGILRKNKLAKGAVIVGSGLLGAGGTGLIMNSSSKSYVKESGKPARTISRQRETRNGKKVFQSEERTVGAKKVKVVKTPKGTVIFSNK